MKHGLEETAAQLLPYSEEFKEEAKAFLKGLISHYVLDDGNLVVAHAGLPEAMHGRASGAVRAFCLYGETTGAIDEFGLPVRYNWAKDYRGKAMVVYGHTPIPQPDWLNNTLNIDTGCVFGGALTALRYPEKEVVQVQSKKQYCVPAKPIETPESIELQAAQEFDDLLSVDLVSSKFIVETRYQPKVIIREQQAAGALEVMSRFAIGPKALAYLPPTMSPPESSGLPDFLEHPKEVFDYYRKKGMEQLICEEKHMGSRAIAWVFKEDEVAISRFGLPKENAGVIYTRTGRRFFDQSEHEQAFLQILREALTAAGFWEEFDTNWVCLDGELLPWSAKAKALIVQQYAAVAAAAKAALGPAQQALLMAKTRGMEVGSLLEQTQNRKQAIEAYYQAYGQYCELTNGIEGLRFAPFHLMATEGKTYFEQSHSWHMEQLANICAKNEAFLLATACREVQLGDAASEEAAIDWWLERCAAGGEGMVVKPFDFVPKKGNRLIQPAMKCRGREYLRMIYGPEYLLGDNLQLVRKRSVKKKRELALQEFSLGLEGLHRFVEKAPLHEVHECVFGVLALETEEVDPRL